MAKAGSKATSSPQDQQSLLEQYFIKELKDVLGAEKLLVKSIPKLQKAAQTDDLKDALEEHLSVTEEHINRLERVFQLMDKKSMAKKCIAMEGITKEGAEVVKELDESMTRDAAIIMAAQKAEHYEIAAYGGLVQLAKTMGRDDVAEVLAQTLEEEKEADLLLTEIAERFINVEASQEEPEE